MQRFPPLIRGLIWTAACLAGLYLAIVVAFFLLVATTGLFH